MEIKEKIVQQSEELFLKYGIRSVSMDDIASKLGMSKKTLYNFFENKKDLINHVIIEFIKKEKECTNEILLNADDAIDEILGIAKHVLQFLKKMKPTTMFDLQKYYAKSWSLVEAMHFKYIEETIKNNLEKGKKEGLYRSNLSSDIISKLYIAKTKILNDEDMFPSSSYSRENLFKEFIHYHLHGIVSKKGFEKINKIDSI